MGQALHSSGLFTAAGYQGQDFEESILKYASGFVDHAAGMAPSRTMHNWLVVLAVPHLC